MADPEAQAADTSARLLEQARHGNASARDRLIERYLPALRRWAHGRLPGHARDVLDSDDLVQMTLLRSIDRIEDFEPRRQGAFLAYLRTILMNQVRDQVRRVARRPGTEELGSDLEAPTPSPLETAIGRQDLDRYERALERLSPEQQEAVVMSIEMGFTHREIAEAQGRPSANAARMFVARALVQLGELLDEGR